MGSLLRPERGDRVLAIYAHPDDPEISCGGALRIWADAGAVTHAVIGTRGDKGSADPNTVPDELAERRRVEVAAAADEMGLSSVVHLDLPDGEVENDLALRELLVEAVRELRPNVVIGPDPTAVFFGDSYINHHDHRTLGWAILDAVAPAAASPHYFPAAGPAHLVSTLLLSGTFEADVWVDVDEALDHKIRAVACHRSQVDDHEFVADAVRARAAEAGRQAGVRHAEAFRRIRLG